MGCLNQEILNEYKDVSILTRQGRIPSRTIIGLISHHTRDQEVIDREADIGFSGTDDIASSRDMLGAGDWKRVGG
jgi:hypothetical protein